MSNQDWSFSTKTKLQTVDFHFNSFILAHNFYFRTFSSLVASSIVHSVNTH